MAAAVILALDAAVDAEAERGLQCRARDVDARLGLARRAVGLRELGPGIECARLERRELRGRSRGHGVDVGRLERGVERAVQQEVQPAARLLREVARFAQLLLDLEQLGAGAQHLVLRHLAVAVQRVVDAQVLGEQRAARVDDRDGLGRAQPVEIADRDVALQPAREREPRVLARRELRALGAHAGRDRRRVERLRHRDARVLLALAQEGDRLVLERRIDLRQRQRELAATLAARVTGIEREGRQPAGTRCIERRDRALDIEALAPQREIRGEALAHVVVDDVDKRARDRGAGECSERAERERGRALPAGAGHRRSASASDAIRSAWSISWSVSKPRCSITTALVFASRMMPCM